MFKPGEMFSPTRHWHVSPTVQVLTQNNKKRPDESDRSLLVGVRGLEPPTSRSQTAHSSQLSYTPLLTTNCIKLLHFYQLQR
jgi:hypothetical protein